MAVAFSTPFFVSFVAKSVAVPLLTFVSFICLCVRAVVVAVAFSTPFFVSFVAKSVAVPLLTFVSFICLCVRAILSGRFATQRLRGSEDGKR